MVPVHVLFRSDQKESRCCSCCCWLVRKTTPHEMEPSPNKCYQLYMYWKANFLSMWPPWKRSIIAQETVSYITSMSSFIEEGSFSLIVQKHVRFYGCLSQFGAVGVVFSSSPHGAAAPMKASHLKPHSSTLPSSKQSTFSRSSERPTNQRPF